MNHAITKTEFKNLNSQLKNLQWKQKILKKSFLKRIKSGMIFINNSKKISWIRLSKQIKQDVWNKFVNLLNK